MFSIIMLIVVLALCYSFRDTCMTCIGMIGIAFIAVYIWHRYFVVR